MKDEIYEQARLIKCQIQDLNKVLESIEIMSKKYKDDYELIILLQNYHARVVNDIAKLKQNFNSL